MCGVAGGIGKAKPPVVAGLRHRGPDAEGIVEVDGFWIGHTRLAVRDLDPRSNQPFYYQGVVLSYNGELWNADDLRRTLEARGLVFTTTGDTEVIAAALSFWGEGALPRLRGMFAVVWYSGDGLLRAARDRMGEVPLHYTKTSVVSEMKALPAGDRTACLWVEPGGVIRFNRDGFVSSARWYTLHGQRSADGPVEGVRSGISSGVEDRRFSDVPVCCLLSGGVDSSAIAGYLKTYFPGMVCYTARGESESRDLRCAREVASFLEMPLVEVLVRTPTADQLSSVVYTIEQDNKAQVEIAWACLALAAAMQSDGFKVTYSGEGSDELWGSYGLSYHGIKKLGFYEYRRRLVFDQHRKNFARANKVFMSHGVECRLPFLDTGLVEHALSLSEGEVRRGSNLKAVFCDAVEGVVPESVRKRAKMTFQDGVGLQGMAESAVKNPRRFYESEYRQAYGRSA